MAQQDTGTATGAGGDDKSDPQALDPASGNLDMGARRFSPDTRRFLQQDQYDDALADVGLSEDPLTSNRYSLAAGNPVSFVESDGHEPVHGSFRNNPDRDNQYGGRANSNINRNYNYQATRGTWQIRQQGSAARSGPARYAGPVRRRPVHLPGAYRVFAPDAGRHGKRTVPNQPVGPDGEVYPSAAESALNRPQTSCACLPTQTGTDRQLAFEIAALAFGGPEYLIARAGVRLIAGGIRATKGAKRAPEMPRDFQTKATLQRSATFGSEGEARALARQKVGSEPIEVGPQKLRSQDGRWQYRARPGDVSRGHVHLERLDPRTGEVLQNWHLRWREPR